MRRHHLIKDHATGSTIISILVKPLDLFDMLGKVTRFFDLGDDLGQNIGLNCHVVTTAVGCSKYQLHTSHLTAAMYTGLTDLDDRGNIIPGIAESWEPNKDLTSWVFKLRKGVLFHNGRGVDETRLMHFENYWETDAEGNNLPYLDEIIAKPKREDSVRLTALHTGRVQFINTMANADVARFKKDYSDAYNTWTWHQGGRMMVFNFRRGPFQDKRLRTASAHAINREAIHHVVYYGNGSMNNQPYPEWSRWHMDGIRMLEYDPERAKALLKAARAVGTEIKLVCSLNNTLSRESGQVVQDQWNAVGFKVTVEPLDTVPFRQARAKGAFDGLINGHTYRYDPDDFYGRNLHSKSEYAQILSGWQNERCDRLSVKMRSKGTHSAPWTRARSGGEVGAPGDRQGLHAGELPGVVEVVF